ncbi:MAG: type II toxin-antitoxin system RelE/ParE family toxin [Burkholderiales bacterium]|nr:type II toxin-antitoxin system RelE/ParE family toxin [Burkholderiales bacterium]
MPDYAVVFAPEAEEQLVDLYLYIADEASPDIARGYTEAIVDDCLKLNHFPLRGVARHDIRPGLRITHHKGRAVIAFHVDEAARRVSILGVYYGGQDYASALRQDGPD